MKGARASIGPLATSPPCAVTTATGMPCDFPFTVMVPPSASSKGREVRSMTLRATITVPGWARAVRRAARFVGSPMTV